MLVTDSSNRLQSMPNFPLLYPNAGIVDPRYYAHKVLTDLGPGWFDGTQDQSAAGVRMGQPHHGHGRRRRAAWAAQSGLSRIPEHQSHAGCRDQPDEGVGQPHQQGRLLQQPQLQGPEHRRGRRGEPRLPGLRELRQRHQQRARYRLRLRQRGGRCVHAVPAAVDADRRQHDLQQHRVLPAGQLEGEPADDAGLRRCASRGSSRSTTSSCRCRTSSRTSGRSAPRRCSTSRAATTGRPSAAATRATRSIRAPARS